jgi:hypothetical protein
MMTPDLILASLRRHASPEVNRWIDEHLALVTMAAEAAAMGPERTRPKLTVHRGREAAPEASRGPDSSDPYPSGPIAPGYWLWANLPGRARPYLITEVDGNHVRVVSAGGVKQVLPRTMVKSDVPPEKRDIGSLVYPLHLRAPTPSARVQAVLRARDHEEMAARAEEMRKLAVAQEEQEIGPWIYDVGSAVRDATPSLKASWGVGSAEHAAAMRALFRAAKIPLSTKIGRGTGSSYIEVRGEKATAADWAAADRIFPGLLGHKSRDHAMFDYSDRAGNRGHGDHTPSGIRVARSHLGAYSEELREAGLKALARRQARKNPHTDDEDDYDPDAPPPEDLDELAGRAYDDIETGQWYWYTGNPRTGAPAQPFQVAETRYPWVRFVSATNYAGVWVPGDKVDLDPPAAKVNDPDMIYPLYWKFWEPADQERAIVDATRLRRPDGRDADLFDPNVRRNPAGSSPKANPPGSHVQSLLFDRAAGWTPTTARDWAQRHGFKHSNRDMEVTDGKVRVRQLDPGQFARFTTMRFGREAGIQAVLGWTGKK